MQRNRNRPASSASWEGVADWYTGWVGKKGSVYHRRLAVPLLMDLLKLRRGERLADLGCGPGILAPAVRQAGAQMVGIDLSSRLIDVARSNHGRLAQFVVGDVTRLPAVPELAPQSFDAASFMLSIQDIDPLAPAVASAATLLKPDGRLAIVMLHPCFRVPRQSSWGFDEKRALTYRRVDSYATELAVPMQGYGDGRTTRSYHRPLSSYFAALGQHGFAVTSLREASDLVRSPDKSARRGNAEFPLLLGLLAEKR
ncbi:MAG TPA: class I SAM-dependent methyltransferase [Devosia sp.]